MLIWPTTPTSAYHGRSECGRFSVARINAGLVCWYEAYRWPGTLLGATRVPITASATERLAAIRAMRELCEAEAGVQSPPTATEGTEQ